MADVIREEITNKALLSTTNRVEAPFVRVSIGNYTFGVFEGQTKIISQSGIVTSQTKYPNYIQKLRVKKINGTVNQYTLNISYPVTEFDDPNFFEKIFSSVSGTRKIVFSYGDSTIPEYAYKNEEGIITKISTDMNIASSVINYIIEAVSVSSLSLSGSYTFPTRTAKPSDVIKDVLYNSQYHLTDVFTGMKDRKLVEQMNLIASDDSIIKIPTKTNMSALDYIAFLTSCMGPNGTSATAIRSNFYALTTYEDEQGRYKGPYFKIQKVEKASNYLNKLCTYEINIGYPSANIVTSFRIQNQENWSLYYDYNQSLDSSNYLKRINSQGDIEYIYSPNLKNDGFEMTASEAAWWSKVTQYPISATLVLKGLLKPAVLMQYVKLNVWYFGHKHISSGYYIIKSQIDDIGLGNYSTTLELLRIAEDDDFGAKSVDTREPAKVEQNPNSTTPYSFVKSGVN